MIKLTKSQKRVIDGLKNGQILWRYSTQNTAYLLTNRHDCTCGVVAIRKSTIETLEEAGLIEEDNEESFYRAGSGSDIRYKLVSK